MDTLLEHVARFVRSVGKSMEEIASTRVTRSPSALGALWWEVEIDFDNSHVVYTRVVRFWLDGDTMRYKSPTLKTRLHVPVREVPTGALAYTIDGDGPYRVHEPFSTDDLGKVYPISLPDTGEEHELLDANSFVSVEFYYAKGIGAVAGDKLMALETQIATWVGLPTTPPLDIADLVNGCKFDLWAVAYTLSRDVLDPSVSVFDLPTAE